MSRYYSSVKHRKWQRHYHLDAEEVDPVVTAATAHLNSPVVFNFVSKASLADCVIHGTTTPSMGTGSFSSTGSGFPFNYDAYIVSGITTTTSSGEFVAAYITDIDITSNANAAVFRTSSIGNISCILWGTSASQRSWRYGGSGANVTANGASHVIADGAVYMDGSLDTTISYTSSTAESINIGGVSFAPSQIKCNYVYFVYAPSIATSAAAAAAAIHSAMVSGAP